MQIVLAWKKTPNSLSIENVVRNLQRLYSEIFQPFPSTHIITGRDFCLVYLKLTVKGWKADYQEHDERTWVLSLDFPFNASQVCKDASRSKTAQNLLLPVARSLDNDPESILSRLSPHFALFWGDQQGSELKIQVDGLGFCQLFEYMEGDNWAVASKILAFKALELDVRPDPAEFAVKFALKGFPNELSGFKKIRQFSPGQRCTLSGGSVKTEIIDVLGKWIRDDKISVEESLELGRTSLLEELKAASELWEEPIWTGLTGGRDTRAIVSTLMAGQFDFRLRVRGKANSYDVRIAKELAEIAERPLKIEEDAVLPPDTPDMLFQKARLAVLWQGGHQLPNLIKMFLAGRDRLDGGFTNLMGQHGEIGRGMYEIYLKLTPPSLSNAENEALLFNLFSAKHLPNLKKAHQDRAREEFSIAYNRLAEKYNLHGWRRLNFYGLTQHTRRYNSGGHYAQSGQVITPFLNVDFIRASYNIPVENLRFHPFHEYIVKHHYPSWASIGYDQEAIALDAKRREHPVEKAKSILSYYVRQLIFTHRSWMSPYGGDDFIAWRYWNRVGSSVINDALRHGGMWEDIFETKCMTDLTQSSPDEILLLYCINDVFS